MEQMKIVSVIIMKIEEENKRRKFELCGKLIEEEDIFVRKAKQIMVYNCHCLDILPIHAM